jgi:hypothetical protein
MIGNKQVASILYKQRFHDVSSIRKLGTLALQMYEIHKFSVWKNAVFNIPKVIHVFTTGP